MPARLVIYVLVSLFAAFLCAIGHAFAETGYFASTPLLVLAETIGMALLFLLMLLGLERLPSAGAHGSSRLARYTPQWKKASVALFSAIMFAFWLPYLIALYPTSFGYDTISQIAQFYPGHGAVWQSGQWFDVQFLDNNPVFDTLLFGSFAYASDLLFGSWNQGLFLYVLIQSLLQATGLTLCCAYLSKHNFHPALVGAAFLFFCLFPVFPINAATTIKDTLFSMLFIYYFLATLEIVATRGEVLQRAGFAAAFALISLLLVLTKKTGLYLVGAETLVLLICYHRQWRALLLTLGVALATMFVLLPYVLFPLLNVGAGGGQESLGLLFQQTARYVVDHPDDVTDEERKAIDAVIDYDQIPQLYDPKINDDIKYTYRVDTATREDVSAYIRVWLAQTLRHPDSSAKALIGTLAPFFDPYKSIDLYLEVQQTHVYSTVEGGDELIEGSRARVPEWLEGARKSVQDGYYALSHAPLVRFLFSNTLFGNVIPCLAFALLLARRRFVAALPLVVLVVLLIGSYLIAPVAWSRYLFPLIYIAPMVLLLGAKGLRLADKKESAV